MKLSGFGVVLVGLIAACSSSSNSGGSLDGGLLGSTSTGTGTGTGGGPPPGCTAFSACGGNVVGTWTISTLCGPGVMQTQAITGCTGGTGTITISTTGSLVFGADLSYTVMTTTSGTAVEKLPKSCFAGTTCAQVQDALLMQGAFSGGTCTDDGTNCNCNLTLAPMPNTETGTYTISGSTISTTPTTAGAAPGTSQFCVSGNQLSVASTDTTQPMLVIVARK